MTQEALIEEYKQKLNQLAFQLLAQNMASKFTGKLEVWFNDGQVNNAINTQKFSGTSYILPDVVLYSPKPIDNPDQTI